MIHALLSGQLVQDPVRRETRTGKPLATALVKVSRSATLAKVAAFDHEGIDKLLALRKGDAVSAAGALTVESWVDPATGIERYSLRLTAETVLTFPKTNGHHKANPSSTEPMAQEAPHRKEK